MREPGLLEYVAKFWDKNSSGVAKILLSSLKILARLGATFVKSTAGISNALFVFNGDS